MDKDPNNWDAVFWLFLAGLGVFGGIIRYFDDLRKEAAKNPESLRKFEIFEMIAKAFSSAFVCIVIYFICQGLDLDSLVSLGLSGVASYFGTESLGIIFRHFDKGGKNDN